MRKVTLFILLTAVLLFGGTTAQFTIPDNTQPYNVVADVVCSYVTVRENTTAPTTDYDAYEPSGNQIPVRKYAGEGYTFTAANNTFYQPGAVVGQIKIVTGTNVVFSKVEQ